MASCKCFRLCPVSVGLAAGLTLVLVTLVNLGYAIMKVSSAEMESFKAQFRWGIFTQGLAMEFVQAFVAGFIFVIIYNGFLRLTKKIKFHAAHTCCCGPQCNCGGCGKANCCTTPQENVVKTTDVKPGL
jgi:hypothetical protein